MRTSGLHLHVEDHGPYLVPVVKKKRVHTNKLCDRIGLHRCLSVYASWADTSVYGRSSVLSLELVLSMKYQNISIAITKQILSGSLMV
jgi:hypothetical protein